ncbi:MAG: FG-GAP-like repeat-containing protein [Bacteroidales bacterium]
MRRFYTSIILLCVLSGFRLSAQAIPASQVYISEVMFDSPLQEDKYVAGEHNNGEYIKLFNPTDKVIDLTGWTLTGQGVNEQYIFPPFTYLPPNQILLVAYRSGSSFNFFDYYHIPSTTPLLYQNAIILFNKGEQIVLYNAKSQLVDAFSYTGNLQGLAPVSLYAKNRPGITYNKIKSLHRKQITYKNGIINSQGNVDLYANLATPAQVESATTNNTITPNEPIVVTPSQSSLAPTVGSIPGQFAVSPSGAATYSIPIECPAGINGMQPNISLVYNSQGGNGPLGVGFAISGLSSISRTTKNLYTDGIIAGMTFTSADIFSIDGNRLIWDGTKYVTEQRTYSLINSVGTIPATDCPQSFKVTNKDGQTIEYGTTPESRLTPVGAPVPMQWFINKTTDANGNYMTFTYQSQGGQTVLKQIDYTGNGSKQLFASIVFNYINKSTIKTTSLLGYSIGDRFLLDNVEIKSNGTILKQYKLNYKYEKENYFITSIDLTGLNNVKVSPIIVQWGADNSTISVAQSNVPTDTDPAVDSLEKSYLSTDIDGDGYTDLINIYKDSKVGSDIRGNSGIVKVFRNTASSGSPSFENTPMLSKRIGRQFVLGPEYSVCGGIVTGSFHGNAKKTIIVPSYNQRGGLHWVSFQDLSSKPIIYSDTHGTTGMGCNVEFYHTNCWGDNESGDCETIVDSIVDIYKEKQSFTQRLKYGAQMTAYTVSDLNNDGIDEIVSVEKTHKIDTHPLIIEAHDSIYYVNGSTRPYHVWIPKKTFTVIDAIYPCYGKIFYVKKSNYNHEGFSYDLGDRVIAQDFDINPSDLPDSEIGNIMAADCNGDGLKDLIVLTKAGCTLFKNNGGGVGADGIVHPTFTKVVDLTEFNSDYSGVKAGDFNGDGLMDLVLNEKNSAVWKVAINNGNFGFNYYPLSNFTATEESFTERNNDKDDCIVTDFNNDGKSDIVMVDLDYDYNDDIVSYPWGTYNNTHITWYASKGTSFEAVNTFAYNDDAEYSHNRFNVTGDFNGDGREDLLTYGSNLFAKENRTDMLYLHSSFNMGFGANFVRSFTDGYGDATTINYQPLNIPATSGGGDFYTKSTGSVYPIVDVVMPSYCVKSIVQPNGVGGNSISEYAYSGAKVHLTGKGMLGFQSNTVSNSTSNRKSVSTTEMDYNLFLPTLQTTITSTYGGSGISKSETTFLNAKVGSIYDSRPLKTTNTDLLSGLVESTETTGYVDGNPTQIITKKGNLTTTKDVIYNQFGSWAWCKNKPTKVTTTRTQTGAPDVRVIDYTYDATTGNEQTETADPGNENSLVTKYEDYDQFGRAKKVSLIANGKTRASTVVYKPSGRFVDSKTDHLGETTSYVWDETKGLLTSETNRIGTTTYYYDGLGQLSETVYPTGIRKKDVLQWAPLDVVNTVTIAGTIDAYTTTVRSNSKGCKYYKYTEVSGSAPVTVWYDAQGQERVKETYGLNGKKISVFTEYNSDGSVYRVSDPTFNTTPEKWANTYQYDDYGRPQSVTTSFGTTITSSYQGTTTTVSSPETTKSTTLNSAGQVESVTTNGKSVSFTYYASGSTQSSTPQDGQPISMEYDIRGNRTKLTDPDAGVVESKYNGFGELMWERQKVHNATDWVTTTHNYDPDGHGILQSITRGAETTSYTYDPVVKTRVTSISIANKNTQTFTYDQFDRVTSVVEDIKGKSFTKSTEYDALGRAYKQVYPSGYYTYNVYDAYSNLIEVKDNANRSIWKVVEENARGQLTRISKGGKETRSDFDDRGLPTAIYVAGVVDAGYLFDEAGNLKHRIDNLTSQREDFTYDGHNRLRTWTVLKGGVSTTNTLDYDETTGNISKRSGLDNLVMKYEETNTLNQTNGSYVARSNPGPHALTSIQGVPSGCPATALNVTYTDFKKIASLSEGNKYYTLDYGVDDQRRMSVYSEGGSLKQTRYYVGYYEEEVDASGNVRKIHYLSGAILIQNRGVDSLLYSYTDFQGSLIALTDANGTVVEKYAYDPWGARRDPNNWAQKDTRVKWVVNRGYTGHEHLDAFGIINMNGRVYDPLTAMFMSPDPYVQSPDNWLNYNRYGYCYGNPFKYTDPSGEWFFTALLGVICPPLAGLGAVIDAACWGATIGAAGYTIGCIVNGGGWSSSGFWSAVGMGAISGIITGGIGDVFGKTGTWAHELGRAVVHGFAQGAMSAVSGGDFMQGFLSGSLASLGGHGLEKVMGRALSTAEAVGFSSLSGGIGAELSGGDFLKGATTGAIIGLLNQAAHSVQKKAMQYAEKYKANQARALAYSVVMEALLETADPSEVSTKIREKLVETYGSQNSKDVNKVYSDAISVMKEVKSTLDKQGFEKITNRIMYSTLVGLGLETIKLNIYNQYNAFRLKSLDTNMYNTVVLGVQPHYFGGAGAGGEW